MFDSVLVPAALGGTFILGFVLKYAWSMFCTKKKMVKYEHPKYWDVRYSMSYDKDINHFEWYTMASQPLTAELTELMPAKARVLELGCGQSRLNEAVLTQCSAKITSMVSTDFSDVCIQTRKLRNKEGRITYQVEDNCKMTFRDNSFDAVVEKATFDSTITDFDAAAKRRAREMLSESVRVLKNGGFIFSVSVNNPTKFQEYYTHPMMTVESTRTVVRKKLDANTRKATNMNFYIYVLRKKA